MGIVEELFAEREKRKAERDAAKMGPAIGFRTDPDVDQRLRRITKRMGVALSDTARTCLRRGLMELEREEKAGKAGKGAEAPSTGKARR